MEKHNSEAHKVLNEVEEVLTDSSGEGTNIKPKVTEAIKRSKDIINSVFENTKSVLDEATDQSLEEKEEQEVETIEEPLLTDTLEIDEKEDKNDEEWSTLNETHKILSDVSEILK